MTLKNFIFFVFFFLLSLIFLRKWLILSSLTGGKLDQYLRRWEIYAPKSYAQIRETDDIDKIAQNTKLSTRKIKKIKEHLFINQHQLDDGVRLFDPDIADAWFRLQRGDFATEDLRLLEHEYFEARFEVIFQTDYRTAHNTTIRSGRIWNPL